MVRKRRPFYDRYSWISNGTDKIDLAQQDDLLLELLIWFLNHPSQVVKNRTIEVLTWPGTVIPEIIVKALVEEITSEGYKVKNSIILKSAFNSKYIAFQSF